MAKAAPDGHTLLLGVTGSNAIAASLFPRLPYDTLKDFIGVSPLARGHVLLVANPRIPATNLKALVALAKAWGLF